MSKLPYSPLTPEENKIAREKVELRQAVAEPKARSSSHLPLIAGGTLVILALAGAAFAYYYFFLQKPLPNVSLTLSFPDKVLFGEPFSGDIAYANNSDQTLRGAAIAVSLPQGVSIVGSPDSQRFYEDSLGDVAPGSYGKRTLAFIATDGPQSVKNFVANLRYSVTNNTGSQFRNEQSVNVAVGTPAVDVNVNAPQSIMSAQDSVVTFNYQNNSQNSVSGVRLVLNPTSGLDIKESTGNPPANFSSPGTWDLGTLAPGATGTVNITISYTGDPGYLSLPAKLTADFSSSTYTIWSQTPSITVSQSPLTLIITANDSKNYITRPGDEINYKLTYHNNSQVPIQNMSISATLVGSMLDYSNLRTGGTFNSINNTLTWNSVNTHALASVDPGAEGYVSFSVRLQRNFTIRRISDKNFDVKLQATIESATVPPGVSATQTISSTSLDTKVAGDIALQTLAYYYEPTAGITNKGPFPPKVNQPTQFTVHWRLVNSATDMSGVHLEAKLPPGVSFTGKVQSTTASKPVYDSGTGKVTWDIPLIPATQGIVGAPAEAIFQVETTPASNMIGQAAALIGPTSLTAQDAWVNQPVSKSVDGKDSNVPDDPRVGLSGGNVRQ